jgi:hypothetical protein
MNTQPEALRLAGLLETDGWPDAAAELLRLHEVNQMLVEALEFVVRMFLPYKDDFRFSQRLALERAVKALAQQTPDEFCIATTEELMKTLGCSDEKAKEIHDGAEAIAKAKEQT